MNVAEACNVVAQLTRELSQARAERDAYRLVAQQAVHHGAELTRRLQAAEERHLRALAEYRRFRARARSGRAA